MVEIGNPNSITDAGVGAISARGGVLGAWLNVKINAKDLEDKTFVADILSKGQEIVEKTRELEQNILNKMP